MTRTPKDGRVIRSAFIQPGFPNDQVNGNRNNADKEGKYPPACSAHPPCRGILADKNADNSGNNQSNNDFQVSLSFSFIKSSSLAFIHCRDHLSSEAVRTWKIGICQDTQKAQHGTAELRVLNVRLHN